MEPFRDGTLTILPTQEATTIRLEWRGSSTARHPRITLDPFFERITSYAKSSGADIEMSFEALEEMNSSTMTAVLQLIQRLKTVGVRLTLLYDAGKKWQRLSFEALHVFQRGGGFFVRPR